MRKRPLCLMALLLTAGILLARWMGISWIWRSPGGSDLEEVAEKKCSASAEGTVYQQEEKIFTNQTYTYLYLKHTNLCINSKNYPIRNLKCVIEKEMPSLSGCRLRVKGILTLPELPGNPGEFNKREYEHSRKIDFYLEKSEVEGVIGKKETISGFFGRIRENAIGILEKIFPAREAGILEAMLLGEKEQLEPEVKGLYQAAGISHTIAISGLHISLLGMAVWKILKGLGLPMVLSAGMSFGVLTGYGILIGNPTTAFRALLMFGFMMGARMVGRTYDLLSALAAAGILLLLDNPDLVGNCGFQLSFLAVVGIGWFGQVQRKGQKKKNKRLQSVRESLRTGIFLWFFTLPVVLYSFYQVSFLGILCNLLVLPLMPGVLGSGVLAMVLGQWDIGLGSVAGIPACGILHLYEWMGKGAEKLPFGVWTPGKPSVETIVLYYAAMAAAWKLYGKFAGEDARSSEKTVESRGRRKHLAAQGIPCGTAVILLLLMAEPWREWKQIAVLDVGQGDGIVVQSANTAIMIDGGSSSQSKTGTYVILPYLKHQGISGVEAIFLTHTDEDHINGVQEVLEEAKKGWLTVDHLFMPEWMKGTEAGKKLLRTAEGSGTKCSTLKSGDQVQMGGMKVLVLHPGDEDFSQKPNDGSLAFTLEFDGIRGMFTGDLTVEEEAKDIGTDPGL